MIIPPRPAWDRTEEDELDLLPICAHHCDCSCHQDGSELGGNCCRCTVCEVCHRPVRINQLELHQYDCHPIKKIY